MIVYRNRKRYLCFLLPDNILIKNRLYLRRLLKGYAAVSCIFTLATLLRCRKSLLLSQNIIAIKYTLVTNVARAC